MAACASMSTRLPNCDALMPGRGTARARHAEERGDSLGGARRALAQADGCVPQRGGVGVVPKGERGLVERLRPGAERDHRQPLWVGRRWVEGGPRRRVERPRPAPRAPPSSRRAAPRSTLAPARSARRETGLETSTEVNQCWRPSSARTALQQRKVVCAPRRSVAEEDASRPGARSPSAQHPPQATVDFDMERITHVGPPRAPTPHPHHSPRATASGTNAARACPLRQALQ